MSFSTQALMYGWTALASLGDLTGPTIYSATNQRWQVKAEDRIQVELGAYERCLALQTSTNPVTYSVMPTNFVATWTSNVYTTNGVTIYTNMVTNTIGWDFERDYMIAVDAKEKELVPFYLDTNTVYDGSSNLSLYAVTGLWAQLGIGDKTNKFTRTPAWTNPVSTNWVVSYTSYWPSTAGVAAVVCYTTDYRQVVNYASSWTATGGHVWVTSSNWASEAVTITNVATYGDYPWQIYVQDLQERYKVLNALEKTKVDMTVTGLTLWHGVGTGLTWAAAVTAAKANYAYVTNLPLTSAFRQHAKGIHWVNYYSHGGLGEYGTGDHGGVGWSETNWVTYDIGMNVTIASNLYISGTNVLITSSGNFKLRFDFNEDGTVVDTSSWLMWSAASDMSSLDWTNSILYCSNFTGYSYSDWRLPSWEEIRTFMDVFTVYGWPPSETRVDIWSSDIFDEEFGESWVCTFIDEPSGVWPDWTEAHFYDNWEYQVNSHPAWPVRGPVTPYDPGFPEPLEPDGEYTEGDSINGYPSWSHGSYNIFYTNSSYVICVGTSLDTNSAYMTSGGASPFGAYSAVNFISYSTVGSETNSYSAGPDPSGSYTCGTFPPPDQVTWTGPDGWVVEYDGGTYYVRKSGASWDRIGEQAGSFTGLTYNVTSGFETQCYGQVTCTWIEYKRDEGGGGYDEEAWLYNTWTYYDEVLETDVTTSNFFECYLTKVAITGFVETVCTSMPVTVDGYIGVATTEIGTTNYWDDESLGWHQDAWSLIGSYNATNILSIGAEYISDPPEDTTEPAVDNESTATGFYVTNKLGAATWQFNYATNKYW